MINITLIGPHNCGKTTLFNKLTSSMYKTVNYPGSTIEYCKGTTSPKWGATFNVIDTPGIYSLYPDSIDQQISVDTLFNPKNTPDIAVVVVDSTQLARHLPLLITLKESNIPIILGLTMLDLLSKQGSTIDSQKLGELLGVEVIELNINKTEPIQQLLKTVTRVYESKKTDAKIIKPREPNNSEIISLFQKGSEIEKSTIISAQNIQDQKHFNWDSILLNPVLGFLSFILTMTLIFSSIFWWAAPLMDLIDSGFGFLVGFCKESAPDTWWGPFLGDGIIAGMGSVIIFVPQIFILFVCMSFLEDSGYLARGAMLVDRPLRAIGLTGRSFVPMLSGFACAIPAMMAARTISNKKERLITLLILPLMTCSARLPVYGLIIAFLTPRDKPWLGGLMMTGLYFAGILSGSIIATFASKMKILQNTDKSKFILELPAYKRPQIRTVLVFSLQKTYHYLKKAGPTIMIISVALWLLTNLPLKEVQSSGVDAPITKEFAHTSESWAAKLGQKLEPIFEPMGLDWRGGVAVLCSFAAREVFVSSLALMYRIEDEGEEQIKVRLLNTMEKATFMKSNQKVFTASTCFGILFFFTFALQCFPTVVVCANETKSKAFAFYQLIGFTVFAYVGSIILVQGLRMAGIS